MKIYSISPIGAKPEIKAPKKETTQAFENPQQITYQNVAAYSPISFSARLFRTPENFYEQDFNMKGMPDTMRNYLMADFADRRKMPPAQMMRLVFEDLEVMENVEQAKKHFKDEPLFAELKEPSKQVRTNIVGGLQLLQDGANPEPLFKSGDDNLGIYILRKIYLEGKTLKEINADFKKDAREVYTQLLPEIDYMTLKHYGIKYPDRAFWHSFYSNRENFPYTYTPRKAYERDGVPHTSHNNVFSPSKEVKEQKNKFAFKQKELEDIAESIINGEGNALNTKRALRGRHVNRETENFLFKYMSQIMSISTEKIDLSGRMEEFYRTKGYGELTHTDFSNLTHRQGAALREFWKLNPVLKEYFSNAIKDTIELFTDEYGADGNNERFKQLLEYADGIKPERERLKKLHNEKQKYYDELFKELDAANKEDIDVLKELKAISGKLDEIINRPLASDGGFRVGGIREFNEKYLDLQFHPEGYTKSLKAFVENHPLTSSLDFEMSTKSVLDDATCQKLGDYYTEVLTDFIRAYSKKYFAAKMAIAQILPVKNMTLRDIMEISIPKLDCKLADELEPLTFLQKNKLDETYRQLMKDSLSKKEELQFSRALVEDLFKEHYQKYEMMAQCNPQIKDILKRIKTDLQSSLLKCGLFTDFPFVVRAAYGKNADKSLAQMLCDMAKRFDVVAAAFK